MYRSHFKVFVKTILRNKVLSLINLFGLVIGFAVAMLVWIFVSHELSYDKSFANEDRIFRMVRNWQGSEKYETEVPAPLAEALLSTFPEVVSVTRLISSTNNLIIRDREVFREDLVFAVDSAFFTVFGIELEAGNTPQSLSQPGTVVISLTKARKLFGNTDPIGKSLTFECSGFGTGSKDVIVTGVFDEFPVQSHMRPDYLISSSTFEFIDNPSHFNHFLQTYVLLQTAGYKGLLEKKLSDFMKGFYGEDYYNYSASTYLLQAIQDIHLNTKVYQTGYETSKGNYSTLYFFPALAIFIVLISIINFINLLTSQSLGRRKEVWIKKVSGAFSRQEISFFLLDSVLLFEVGFILAMCLVEIIFPAFETLVERDMEIEFLYKPLNLLLSVSIALILALIAGLYPATNLVSEKYWNKQDSRKEFRSSHALFDAKLIILQFAICIIFLNCSGFIYKQFRYIQSETNQGFNKENILLIKNPWYLGTSHAAFKDILLMHNDISGVASSESVPGIDWYSTWGHPVDSALNDSHISVYYCDYDFAETLGLKMKFGRFFSRDHPTDNMAMVLNEAAIEKLGWKDPIGKRYRLDTVYHVIGVIQDIHYISLHDDIAPLGMVLIEAGSESFISIRYSPGRTDEILDYVNERWREFVPDRPMEYSFMDKEFDFWYKTDRRLGFVTTILSILAIIISCLGLVGLVMYSIIRRTKELGIRKVNGATSMDIIGLFVSDTSKWLFWGFIIAVPVSWMVVKKWMQGFAYKTKESWWVFILAGLAIYIIAIGSIAWQCYKASRQNTINSLRYE